jgi:oligopeptidase B
LPQCVEADFRLSRFALIDRGIVYAIAHVRGGGEMGRQWYEEPDGAKVCINLFCDRSVIFCLKLFNVELFLCFFHLYDPKFFVAQYLCKMNTFNDFVDVARFLVDKNLTDPSKLSCEGRSAGGLLIGAVINQAPELFKVAILGVPFVDVVITMIDSTIPLTTAEWEEWVSPDFDVLC